MSVPDSKAGLADWLERLDLIEDDVQEVLLHRRVFRRLQEIVAANPRLHRPSYLYDYLTGTYAGSAAIAVRRHARQDDKGRDASLIGLLHTVRRAPQVLTRSRRVQLYRDAGAPADLAEAEFDQLAGPGAHYFEVHHIQPDIDNLYRATEELEQYATKRLAHPDRCEPDVILTLDDLDRVLDVFEELMLPCRLRGRSSCGW